MIGCSLLEFTDWSDRVRCCQTSRSCLLVGSKPGRCHRVGCRVAARRALRGVALSEPGSAPGLVDLKMCPAVVATFVWEAVEVALHLNAILNAILNVGTQRQR